MGENRSGSPSMLDLKGPAGENFRGLEKGKKKKFLCSLYCFPNTHTYIYKH